MKPDRSQWQDETAYDYMDTLAIEDLAWEALRRNASYQKDFGRHVRNKGTGQDTEAAIARRWGLRFRCPAEPQRTRPADPLDARCRSCRGRPCAAV